MPRSPLQLLVLLLAVTASGQEPAHSTGGDATFSVTATETVFGTTVVSPSGLRGQIYLMQEDSKALPDFDDMKPVGTIYTNRLNIQPRHFTRGFPGVTNRDEWFAIDYTGRFYISNPSKYSFALISDDGSKLFIDGREIINNDGIHGPIRMMGDVKLVGGLHTFRVSYFQGPRDVLCLVLAVSDPGEKMLSIFNTDTFKPPANPEDWKYGSPADLDKLPDAKAKPRKPVRSSK